MNYVPIKLAGTDETSWLRDAEPWNGRRRNLFGIIVHPGALLHTQQSLNFKVHDIDLQRKAAASIGDKESITSG